MANAGEQPSRQLSLSDSLLELLGHEISDIIDDLEEDHRLWFRDIKDWWSWYDATPHTKVKNWPFKDSANIVVPFIAWSSDNAIGRFHSQLFATDKFWVGTSDNAQFADRHLKSLVKFDNWSANHDLKLYLPVYDMLSEKVPIGESHLALSWRTETMDLVDPKSRQLRTVKVREGPCLEHIPREDILYWQNTDVRDAEVVVRQANYTTNQVRRMARLYRWDDEDTERVIHNPGVHGPSKDVRDYKRKQQGEQRMNEHREFGEHDFREVYVTWPMLKSMGAAAELGPALAPLRNPEVRLVVTIHRNSRKVMRVMPYPYLTTRWNFFCDYMMKRSGQGSSKGFSKKGEHIQRGLTTMFCQSIDATTRNNAIWGRATDERMRDFQFQLNRMVIADKDSFELLNPGNPVPPNVQMVQLLQSIGERALGVNDPMMGRETRMGGHPSTATSTLSLLGESNIWIKMGIYGTRKVMAEVGIANLNLYRQFHTDPSRIVAAIGADDAPGALSWLFPQPGQSPEDDFTLEENLKLDLYGVSETMNPDVERQKAVLKMTATQNFYAQLMQLSQAMASQQATPELRELAVYAMRAQLTSFKEFLESADVDDFNKYIGNLGDRLDQAVALVERQLNAPAGPAQPGQPQLGPGTPAQAGPAGAGGSPPNGSAPVAGMAGGPSPLQLGGVGAPFALAPGGAGGAPPGVSLQ